MSDNSSSRSEGRGCNSNVGSYSTPKFLLPLQLWLGAGLQRPFNCQEPSSQTHALATSSTCRPPHSKVVRANIYRYGIELSKRDLVSLRTRYGIPSSVVMRRLKATERANALPPGLRNIFVVALENGLRFPVHPCVGDVLSIVGICPAQLTPNMWISITGFYLACLLAGVTPITEFFFTSFLQRTPKEDFLDFVVKLEMKGFYEAFLSKVDLESWRPYFFFVSSKGLPEMFLPG
ncbi:hypothetical protein LIER_43628 [Lithospermum erythrorhizon]|uniref:Transposase (putative) gypsy type domain-containing protein n=1 Tax=Lithospermum erythrorhizon TaxID=34254 RepID=A0AAV3QIT0_LITER